MEWPDGIKPVRAIQHAIQVGTRDLSDQVKRSPQCGRDGHCIVSGTSLRCCANPR